MTNTSVFASKLNLVFVGKIMPVRNSKYENNSEINSKSVQLHLPQEKTVNRAKFNATVERKIERLWSQSKPLGWNYNDFVVRVLGVLVVLSHRNKVKPIIAPPRSSNSEIAS
jgi:hypothetical protein